MNNLKTILEWAIKSHNELINQYDDELGKIYNKSSHKAMGLINKIEALELVVKQTEQAVEDLNNE